MELVLLRDERIPRGRGTETLTGMDKTWGRPWSTLWPTLWPTICIWPTGGQIFKNIKIKSVRVEQVR